MNSTAYVSVSTNIYSLSNTTLFPHAVLAVTSYNPWTFLLLILLLAVMNSGSGCLSPVKQNIWKNASKWEAVGERGQREYWCRQEFSNNKGTMASSSIS